MAIKQISEQLKEAQVDCITLRLCFLYFPRLKINLLKSTDIEWVKENGEMCIPIHSSFNICSVSVYSPFFH